MNVGIMGGTFDPIHTGHLIAADRAREAASLDEVWFMPTNVPPHKTNRPGVSAEDRYEMVRRATASRKDFRAVDLEIRMGGVSYTYTTVKELMKRYPDHRFYYIIGGDMVRYLPKWHHIDELASLISFIGLQRPGYEWSRDMLPDRWAHRVLSADMPQLDLSSTMIRDRREQGLSIRYLVTEPVYDYIEEKRLYES